MEFSASHSNVPENKPVMLNTFQASANPGPFVFPGLQKVKINPRLNPAYCFENLVKGECNKMGINAGLSISGKPGKTPFNPLFIFGGPGLGKTHLAQAIGIAIHDSFPDLIVLYVTGNEFKTQYMSAVQQNKIPDFMAYYMRIDVLVVDDIHQLVGPASQNAFFNIFNQLFGDHHQIVVTSDVYSKKVSLPDRLKTRLSQGATYEIKPPEFETRQQIFLSKAEQAHLRLTKDVAFFVAQNIQSNVRELEAAVNKLSVYGASKREKCREEGRPVKQQLDVNDAKTALHDILQNLASSITVESIIKVVADYYHLKIEDFRSKRQYRKVARPRQIAMTLARELTRTSFPQIGECFGGRDHSTVVHACKNIQNLCEKDQTVRTDYENIKAAILSC